MVTSGQRALQHAFAALEAEFIAKAKDPAELKKIFNEMNTTGGSTLSLMEITTWCVGRYPLLNNKPALMRAYKQTCLKEGGNGDAYVDPQEFPMLIVSARAVDPSTSELDHLSRFKSRGGCFVHGRVHGRVGGGVGGWVHGRTYMLAPARLSRTVLAGLISTLARADWAGRDA